MSISNRSIRSGPNKFISVVLKETRQDKKNWILKLWLSSNSSIFLDWTTSSPFSPKGCFEEDFFHIFQGSIFSIPESLTLRFSRFNHFAEESCSPEGETLWYLVPDSMILTWLNWIYLDGGDQWIVVSPLTGESFTKNNKHSDSARTVHKSTILTIEKSG